MSADFNAAIRAASGRRTSAIAEPQRVGDVGIGRGGAARPQPSRAPGMSAVIRAARDLHREQLYDRAWFYEEAARG